MSAARDLLGEHAAFLHGRVSLGTAAVLLQTTDRTLDRMIADGRIPLAEPEWSRGWRRRVRLSDLIPFATVTPETVAAAEASYAAQVRGENAYPSRRKPHGPPPDPRKHNGTEGGPVP